MPTGLDVICTACLAGRDTFGRAMLDAGAKSYTAPPDYPCGNAALMALIEMFYAYLANKQEWAASLDATLPFKRFIRGM